VSRRRAARAARRRLGAARRPGVTPAAIRRDRAGALIPAFPALDRVADGFTRRSPGGRGEQRS